MDDSNPLWAFFGAAVLAIAAYSTNQRRRKLREADPNSAVAGKLDTATLFMVAATAVARFELSQRRPFRRRMLRQ